jgi:ribulose-5-phosphate 4-epimerase/fuculose-1-phosphate aldolase
MNAAMIDEGVVKFEAAHTDAPLCARTYGDLACRLSAWREILVKVGLVGQDAALYGGAGFGNVSGRVGAPSSPRGQRPFLVSGTQTGGLSCAGLSTFCVVTAWDQANNRVVSHGPVRPSSESMTHGAIYDLGAHIRFVLHGHSPALWRRARALGLPVTADGVAYGTPGMAREVQRLYRETRLADQGVLAMGGHEDGVVVFGRTLEEAGERIVGWLARAYEAQCREEGQVCAVDR